MSPEYDVKFMKKYLDSRTSNWLKEPCDHKEAIVSNTNAIKKNNYFLIILFELKSIDLRSYPSLSCKFNLVLSANIINERSDPYLV